MELDDVIKNYELELFNGNDGKYDNLSNFILDNSKDYISIIETKTLKAVYFNSKAHEIDTSEMKGKKIWRFIHPDDIQHVADELKRIYNGDKSGTYTFRFRKNDREYVYLENNVNIVENEKGTFAINIARDVTERIEKEQELKKLKEEYERDFNNTSDVIIKINPEGEIIKANKAISDITGYLINNIIGKKYYNLDFVSEKSKQKITNSIKRLTLGEEVNPYEIEVITREGITKYGELKPDITRDEDGKINGYQGIIRDVTERKQHKKFIHSIVHDIRNPLAVIAGYTELCKNGLDLGEEAVDAILRSTKKIDSIVINYLDAEKISSGKIEINKKEENLEELLKNLCNDMKINASKNNIIIENKYKSRKKTVNIDYGKIEQVFSNLLSNAIKYSPKNTKIRINTSKNHEYLNIKIKDEGMGLTPNEIKKMNNINEPFIRLERMKKEKEGNGVGVYVSRKIVEMHGGKLLYNSKGINQGTTVTVKIPI